MNNYSPIFDACLTAGLIVAALVVAADLALGWYIGRKGQEMMRRGAMWGGQ